MRPRETGKITVARDDAETIEARGVEQIHGVDDHCAIRGVLSSRVGELLDRLDRVLQQAVFPAAEVRFGPVAIDTADAGHAIFCHLGQKPGDNLRRGVVAVDQGSERCALIDVLVPSRLRRHVVFLPSCPL